MALEMLAKQIRGTIVLNYARFVIEILWCSIDGVYVDYEHKHVCLFVPMGRLRRRSSNRGRRGRRGRQLLQRRRKRPQNHELTYVYHSRMYLYVHLLRSIDTAVYMTLCTYTYITCIVSHEHARACIFFTLCASVARGALALCVGSKIWDI